MHSTEAANPVAKLTGSIQGWIQPSPVVDSITVVGRLQPVSAASCYFTTKCQNLLAASARQRVPNILLRVRAADTAKQELYRCVIRAHHTTKALFKTTSCSRVITYACHSANQFAQTLIAHTLTPAYYQSFTVILAHCNSIDIVVA